MLVHRYAHVPPLRPRPAATLSSRRYARVPPLRSRPAAIIEGASLESLPYAANRGADSRPIRACRTKPGFKPPSRDQ